MRLLSGYQKPITALAVSPDGAHLYSAAEGQTMIWQWDLAAGTVARKLSGQHKTGVLSLACSRDGRWLLSVGEYHGVAAWALPEGEGKPLRHTTRDATGQRPGVAISPDGRLGASSSLSWQSRGQRHGVQVWNLTTGTQSLLIQQFDKAVNAVAFSPDGKRLAVGSSDKTVRLFDPIDGDESMRLTHKGVVSKLAFAPGGATLAVACAKTVYVWDLRSSQVTHTLTGHKASVSGLAYSPDGKYLASVAPDGVAFLYDADHAPLGQRHLDVGPLGALAWLADSSGLVAGGEKPIVVCTLAELTGTAHAAARRRGEPLSLAGHDSRVNGLSYSPDGRTLCSWDYNNLRAWDLSRGAGQAKPLEGFTGKHVDPEALTWSPDGSRLAMTSTGPPTIHDARTGKKLVAIRRPNSYPHHFSFTPAGELLLARSSNRGGSERWLFLELLGPDAKAKLFSHRLDFEQGSPDLTHAAAPGEGHNVYFVVRGGGVYRWTPRQKDLARLFRVEGEVRNFAVSADERLAVTTSEGKSAIVWTLPDGNRTVALKHPLKCTGSAFLPGGRVLTASNDGLVRLWDAGGGSEMLTLDLGMGRITSLAVSPDLMTFAAGVDKDHRVVLMDVPE